MSRRRRSARPSRSSPRPSARSETGRTWRSARRVGGRPVSPVLWLRRAGGDRSAVLGEELHHVVEAEATVAPLADAIEGKLAAIAEPLHRIHVEMEHLGDLGRRQHRPELVDGHRPHVVVAFLYARMASAHEGWPGVGCGSLMGGAWGWLRSVAKPYFGLPAGTTNPIVDTEPDRRRHDFQETLRAKTQDEQRSKPRPDSPPPPGPRLGHLL